MKYLNFTCKVLVISLVFVVALAQYQNALGDTTYSLSGRVTNQSGIPLPGTTVDVIDPGTGTTVATTSTDLVGLYSLSVNGGTYNVRVTPPTGSELGSAIALGRVITGDAILDFVLVPAGAATLSGRVLNPLGEGVPSQTIRIAANGTDNWIYSMTASDGSYSFSVSPGDYQMVLDNSSNADEWNVPRVYYMYNQYWDAGILTLNENTIMDIPIPAKRVDVHVQDPLGNAVSGVELRNSYQPVDTMIGPLPAMGYSYYPNWNPPAVTDEAGNAVMWLFPATYTFTATPPSDSSLAITNVPNVGISEDSSITITLVLPVALSGRVLNPLGEGVPSQAIRIAANGTDNWIYSMTASDGSYSFSVSPGNYQMVLDNSSNADEWNVPRVYYMYNQYWDAGILTLNENTIMDIPIPAKRVDVHVQDPLGNAVSGVELRNSYQPVDTMIGPLPAMGYSYYPNWNPPAVTDEAGNAVMWLFPATYTFTATPPSDSPLAITNVPNVGISEDSSITITLVLPVALSGRVLNPLGEGVPSQTIRIAANGTDNWIYSMTASDGSYSFSVSPGDYQMVLDNSSNADEWNVPRVYYMYNQYWDAGILTLNENTIMDIPIPAKRVDVHVQDPLGNAVSGVELRNSYQPVDTMIGPLPAMGYSYYPNWNPPAVTDEAGNAVMWLFPATYTFTVTPPSDSPFAIFNIADTVITNDQSTVIVLQFVHPAPVTSIALLESPNAANEYPDPTTISLSSAAAEGYIIDATYYRVDGGGQQTYTAPFTLTGGGSHTIEYWSVDNLGVFELPKTLSFNIVTNQPPVADAGGPYMAYSGALLALDGSASTDPDNNIASYEWDLDNDGLYDDASGVTVTRSFSQFGDHIIGLRVTDDGGLSDTDIAVFTVLPYTLNGFYQPVDMNDVYNIVKGGSTVPLKFEIFAGTTELTDIAYIKSLTYAQTSCDATATTDEIETTATGGTSLRYDAAAGQFVYNWKTPKTAGKCYRVTMTTIDGSSLVAYFKLK